MTVGVTADVGVVAIDGPSGAGKSTLAAALALRLGVERLDTGAMYRALALLALRNGVAPCDGHSLSSLARSMDLRVGERVLLGGEDVSDAIRDKAVDEVVSVVASHGQVRQELVRRQRLWAQERGGGVVEGRDIGTVVFPRARLKIFLTADPSVRAARRAVQGGQSTSALDVQTAMAERDRFDSSRSESPLSVAEDARVIDSTSATVGELVEEVMSWL